MVRVGGSDLGMRTVPTPGFLASVWSSHSVQLGTKGKSSGCSSTVVFSGEVVGVETVTVFELFEVFIW